MGYGLKDSGATARGIARTALGIIVLFIGLIWRFALLVTDSGAPLTAGQKTLILCLLVLLSVLVLAVFYWLVCKHGDKLFPPGGVRTRR